MYTFLSLFAISLKLMVIHFNGFLFQTCNCASKVELTDHKSTQLKILNSGSCIVFPKFLVEKNVVDNCKGLMLRGRASFALSKIYFVDKSRVGTFSATNSVSTNCKKSRVDKSPFDKSLPTLLY